MFAILETATGEHTLFAGGELWGETGQQFGEWMEKLHATGCPAMVVDLSAATGMNSSGIGKLLSVLRRAVEEKRTLRIRGCGERLYDLFRIIKLDTILEISRE